MGDPKVKEYLDYAGLQSYDIKIKEWIRRLNSESYTEVQEAINELKELIGDKSVDEKIAKAVADLVNSAPESFDTLKEIADWIQEHGDAASSLVEQVAALEADLEEVKSQIDGTNKDIFNPISETYIAALFLDAVPYDSSKTLSEQLESLGENDKLVINASENAVIAEDFNINSDCVIEAEGVEFTGTITVSEDVDASIIGATFSGEIIVQ